MSPMKKTFRGKQLNVPALLRQAGYHPIMDRQTATSSWVRNLGRAHYPRFHLYVQDTPDTLTLNLHLDQKQSTMNIPGLKRHAGEYDGTVVEEEMGRLERWVNYASSGRR